MAKTLVCLHAHPDDEAMLTAGTMAKAAAAGHRVVLVVATRGEVGDVDRGVLGPSEDLGHRRWDELAGSATILGVARTEWLGYADSGDRPDASPTQRPHADGPTPFAAAEPDEAAAALAAILDEEHADVLTSYDRNGGYGHPDHVQVHRVAALAAGRAVAPPVLLEATIDRDLLATGAELAASLGFELPGDFTATSFERWYTDPGSLTHTIDVSDHLAQKKAAMAAHASQATAADPTITRTLATFVSLPDDYFALAFGTEWYVEPGRVPGPPLDDVFATLSERL